MPTLLHIDSSPRAASISSQLAVAFVRGWQQRNPTGTVIHHNTTLEKLPYIDEAHIAAAYTPVAKLTPEQKQKLAYSDMLVDELLAADAIVLGVPMWNLSIPASLKAWIDMIVREGRTFVFTAGGVAPLVPGGKRVFVFTARGGSYSAGSLFQALDHQEPYLRTILGHVGLTEIEFVYAENQGDGDEAAAEGLAKAETTLARLAA